MSDFDFTPDPTKRWVTHTDTAPYVQVREVRDYNPTGLDHNAWFETSQLDVEQNWWLYQGAYQPGYPYTPEEELEVARSTAINEADIELSQTMEAGYPRTFDGIDYLFYLNSEVIELMRRDEKADKTKTYTVDCINVTGGNIKAVVELAKSDFKALTQEIDIYTSDASDVAKVKHKQAYEATTIGELP